MARQISEAGRLGRGQYYRDADVLSPTACAPQAFEEHEYAGAAERRDQAPDTGGSYLPQYRILSATHSGIMRRDPRELAGGQPLSEHEAPGGAEEGVAETGRLNRQRNNLRHGHRICTT